MKDGGPAFASSRSEFIADGESGHGGLPGRKEIIVNIPGMSLRDYFAAAALAGIIEKMDMRRDDHKIVAKAVYLLADAMLTEREKE